MARKQCTLTLFVLTLSAFPGAENLLTAKNLQVSDSTENNNAVLWREPANPATRNLYYGIGGEKDQPVAPYTFEKEDMNGSNPKYVVHDGNNVKWTVKLGLEAQPEIAATRLVWAVGYYTNEDYFLPVLQVNGVPAHLNRGRKLVSKDGVMHNARLKRKVEGEKDIASWAWGRAPFTGSRELNGLKVMMALIDNWDLKVANNKIYSEKGSKEQIYMVSDQGSSFGTTGLSFPFRRSKGDLKSYEHAKFITRIAPDYVNFRTPSRPALIYLFTPIAFFQRVHLDGLVDHIPRADARWIGSMLSGLSPGQIDDAFRAAGYDPAQVAAFSDVVRERITELNNL